MNPNICLLNLLIRVYYTIVNKHFITKENFMFEQISRTRRFGYARVSSQTQEDNSSLEAQKQEFIQKGVLEKKYSY